jgi:hypothetical protein
MRLSLCPGPAQKGAAWLAFDLLRARGFDLRFNPGVGALDPGFEIETGFPADGVDARIAEIARLDANRPLDVFEWMCFPATSATVATSSSTDTYCGQPVLAAPSKSECISKKIPSTISST